MNIYINGAFTSSLCYQEIRAKIKEIDDSLTKICVYGDWKDPCMKEWDSLCEINIIEQKQIQHATHETLHLAITNDLMEDMLNDYYGVNVINTYMIVTSDINFTNLAFKTQKYRKDLYIHIPKNEPENEPELQMFNMSELEKNVKMTFEAHNENFPITRPIPLYIFKKLYNSIYNQSINDFEFEIMIKQKKINIYQSDGIYFIQWLDQTVIV
jgi:hypothetical protein